MAKATFDYRKITLEQMVHYVIDNEKKDVIDLNSFMTETEEYKLVNSIVSNAVFKSNYALAYTDKTGPEVHIAGAKAADELLNIDNVDASFVAYYNAKGISVSARSYGRINVQLIMEDIGGGGHQTMAAAQIDSKSFDEVFEKLNNSIEKFI